MERWPLPVATLYLTLNMLSYNVKRTRLLSSHRRQFIVETFKDG